MNIHDLLLPKIKTEESIPTKAHQDEKMTPPLHSTSAVSLASIHTMAHQDEKMIPSLRSAPSASAVTSIHHAMVQEDEMMPSLRAALEKSGYSMTEAHERNTLTDATLYPIQPSHFVDKVPVHIKTIGRHMNGSFRCHIGTSKQSRPIQSAELYSQMRILVVFFRTENVKSQLVSPEFIFFPTWLLHLFRYTECDSTPGRTDVRFLENANMAKEDHIYRLNHVLNTLFRFNIHNVDTRKMQSAIELANFLFDQAGLDYRNLPRPVFPNELLPRAYQPDMYPYLLLLLHLPRPAKEKPMCTNCNTKPASRRSLCVACYRYHLKHGEPRPLRLIVANRPGPRISQQHHHDNASSSSSNDSFPMVLYSPKATARRSRKYCDNCKVKETHQWYRNLCGQGNWCETCKSYYLRHTKVRPPDLFIKAAKRKVDVRSLVNWNTWSWNEISAKTIELATASVMSSNSSLGYQPASSNMSSPTTSTTSSSYSYPTTPPSAPAVPSNYCYPQQQQPVQKRPSYYSSNSSSPTTSTW